MSFDAIYAETKAFEGGLVDDPDDAGGRTAYGITQRTFTAWLRKQNLPIRDVWTITALEKDAIYRERYWHPLDQHHLSDGMQMAAFDFAVHSGVARAVEHLPPNDDILAYLKSRRAFLLGLIQKRPKNRKYRKGWLRRVDRLQQFLGV